MPLTPGIRLGPYEIVSPLGAGGMGEVYQARDTRLGRDIALKVLGPDLESSPEFRSRFEREARTISRLSHPNVCTLHDVGRHGDAHFLVMELIQGETLARRLERGRMPLSEVLGVGAQIAAGLGAAHAQGVTHRDLKPGNVMLARSGVKLLDFGLARPFRPSARGDAGSAVTTDRSLTTPGTMLGTLPYMAPEQLEGKPAGPAADVFALGVVLYEMSSGRRPFTGDSDAALISAILSSEPPPLAGMGSVPPQLERLIAGCLAKDPERRWQSAADLHRHLLAIGESGPDGPAAGGRASRRLVGTAVAIAALALATVAVVLLRPAPRGGPAAPVRFDLSPPPGHTLYLSVEGATLALAPDGSRIAFVAIDSAGVRHIWTRTLWAATATMVPGSEHASSILWSPDGRSIAFFARGSLMRTGLEGGAPFRICEVAGGGMSGSWGRRGDIVFASMLGQALFRVRASGGVPDTIVRADPASGVLRMTWPSYLPDGERFLCTLRRAGGLDSLVVVQPGRGRRGILGAESRAEYVEGGHLIYVRDGALLAQDFDPRSGRASGSPVAVADDVAYFLSTGMAAFATSANGTLVYVSAQPTERLSWIDRGGREIGHVGGPGNYVGLAISPDGARALFCRAAERIGTLDVWSLDIARGSETRVTSGRDTEAYPVWLPRSNRIVYTANIGVSPWLHARDLGTGQETLLRSAGFAIPGSVTPDGRTLLFQERSGGSWGLWTMPLDVPGDAAPWLDTRFDETNPRVSPDGRYVAFLSNDSGMPEVYVAPFPGPGEKVRVSEGGATDVRWNRARGEILHLSPRGLVATPVASAPRLALGTPVLLGSPPEGVEWTEFDATPDGNRLLVATERRKSLPRHMDVLVRWPQLLGR